MASAVRFYCGTCSKFDAKTRINLELAQICNLFETGPGATNQLTIRCPVCLSIIRWKLCVEVEERPAQDRPD